MIQLCKRLLSRRKKRARPIGIVPRMIAGYMIIIFIPTIVLGTIWYNQAMKQLYSENIEGRKQVIQQVIGNLQVSLRQVERLHTLFQFNSHSIDYLLNMAPTTSEEIYLFMKYIRPLFDNVLLGNESVSDLAIYKMNNPSLPISPEFEPIEAFPFPEHIGTAELSDGMWLFTQTTGSYPVFTYYQTIYSQNFSKEVGVLEIQLKPEATRNIFRSIESGHFENIYLLNDQHQIIYAEESFPLTEEVKKEFTSLPAEGVDSRIASDRWIVQRIAVDELAIDVMTVTEFHGFVEVAQKRRFMLIGTVIVLLLLLTMTYYVMARSITQRIVRLARHMRKVDYDKFPLFPEPKQMDEIGYLIMSYNRMITRLDDLVNKVHRSELRQKEAAFIALQAQIKPHFLYNTLESIRMLAEIEGNEKISELAYSFGQLLRYTIPQHRKETRLDKEIEHVEHYINIHQIRAGKRLRFEKYVFTDPARWTCPPLILQPLVENCIVHGLSASSEPLLIKLAIKHAGDYLYIKVADDGPGIPQEKMEQIRSKLRNQTKLDDQHNVSGGIGIVNVNERIRSYYGEDSEISIFRQGGKGIAVLMKLRVEGEIKDASVAVSG